MQKRPKPRRAPQPPAESRAAEVITIGWMIAVLSTLACELIGVAARLYARVAADARAAELLAGLMLLAALVFGLVSLALIPLVYRARRVPPPRGVTLMALVIGAIPLIVSLLRWLN